MMAALAVFKQVGKIADADFLAMEALPILWSFSLGPLLNLQQFQQFMNLIKKFSSQIEAEQIKKLRDLSSNATTSMDTLRSNDLMNMEPTNDFVSNGDDMGEDDFQRLVLGSKGTNSGDMLGDAPAQAQPSRPSNPQPPVFEWSSPRPSMSMAGLNQPSRTITPDQSLNTFATLSPTPFTGAQGNMQRIMANGLNSFAPMQPAKSNAWPSMPAQQLSQPPQTHSTLSIPSPPQNQSMNSHYNFSIAPPPATNVQRPGMQQPFRGRSQNTIPGIGQNAAMLNPSQQKKTDLDAYESLI